MATARMHVFGGAVWGGNTKSSIRVPTFAEAQQTVLKALLDSPLRLQRRNPLDWVVSLIVHATVLAVLVIAPLFFTQVIDLHNFQLTYLVTPSPPAAPPPPAAAVVHKMASSKLVPRLPSQLVAPAAIPEKVIVMHEPEVAPDVSGGVIGGVTGGVTGGVLSGIIEGTAVPSAPPAAASVPDKKEKEILRLGGDVKPPRQLYAPAPKYPALARSAHISGTVFIEAVIDENGNVVNAHALQGQAVLIPEALRTVMQWKYEPTYLNDVAYPIRMTVTVIFSLGSP